MAFLLKRIVLTLALIVGLAATASAATTWCADPINGSDSNSGVASGTVPNLTNCKQSVEAACALLTTGDTLKLATGYYHDPTYANTVLDSCLVPSSAGTVTMTSYGPTMFGPDQASDASVSAIITGTDCAGQLVGPCLGATTGVKTWTLVSGSIYKTAIAVYPFWVYSNNVMGWPDGPGGLKSAACVSGTCAQSTTNPSQLAVWTNGHVYAANTCVQNGIYPGEWFCTTAGGISGVTTPQCTPSLSSCTAGTTVVSDGGVTDWKLEGVSHATIGPMVAGSWYSDFQFVYVWMPDNSNPNTNVIEIADKLNGLRVNTTTGNNGLNVNHIGFQRVETGLLVFDTSGSGNCIANMTFDHLFFNQTGTSNIDDGMFGNAMRLTGSDPTCNPAYQVTHSYFTNCGEHGGCLTGQVVGGSTFAFINCGPNNHGCINLTQNGTTNPGANVVINTIWAHDATKSQNASVATDSVAGVYAQYTTGLVVENSMFGRILDAGCGGGGQCACGLFAATTGTQFINNTCSGAQNMLAETSGFANTGLIARNNICDNMVSEASSGVCFNIIATGDLSASNNNLLPGTNVALINGTLTSFATWQGDGFDLIASRNSAATFWRSTWPFLLAPGSKGIGIGDATQGNGQQIGAEQLLVSSPNLVPLSLDTQAKQNGY